MNPEARAKLIIGMTEYVLMVHADWFGLWGICGNIFRGVMERSLPDDVSHLNGRLYVSITLLWPYPHAILVSEFKSKADLIDTLLASQVSSAVLPTPVPPRVNQLIVCRAPDTTAALLLPLWTLPP